MAEERRYALILLKGFALGDLVLLRTEEPLSKDECETRLHALLNDPSLTARGMRFGGACVLMQGQWLGSYAVGRE